ncbi:hypothetical protein ACWGKW_29760 [Streptomyces sp. NPDC054766]
MADLAVWDKIHQIEAEIAALQPTQKGWLPKWLDEHLKKWVAANNQLIYESTQAFKTDPSILNISPEMMTVTAHGVSFLGVEIYKFPIIRKLDNSPLSAESRERRQQNLADQRQLTERLQRLERELTAATRRATTSETLANQAQGNSRIPLSRRNLQQVRALDREAAELRTSASHLSTEIRHVRDEMARLEAITRTSSGSLGRLT